ncbi:MAG: ABC transporter ATP-binding protein [Betaproteobacteria bacterium]|nr:ABC transporter ATP-binding protein [Betaproteobacteria bacterium]
MNGAELSLEGVTKSFGGLMVIDQLSFTVRRGSRTALIGPNGAGKTTVFNLVSGVYPIDDGAISLDGEDISKLPPAKRIGHGISRSFQNIRLMPHLSTIENVMLGEHWRRPAFSLARGRRAVEAARSALADAGLQTYPGQVVANLPYGIQKRIEVVRALLAEPRILMLDEPAAGLNTAESDDLRALLERVSARGVTLLLVEHDMQFVRQLCDHVVVLNFGQLIFQGTPDEVHRDPAVLEAYLGADAQPMAEQSGDLAQVR